jgi:hypothetical protein
MKVQNTICVALIVQIIVYVKVRKMQKKHGKTVCIIHFVQLLSRTALILDKANRNEQFIWQKRAEKNVSMYRVGNKSAS